MFSVGVYLIFLIKAKACQPSGSGGSDANANGCMMHAPKANTKQVHSFYIGQRKYWCHMNRLVPYEPGPKPNAQSLVVANKSLSGDILLSAHDHGSGSLMECIKKLRNTWLLAKKHKSTSHSCRTRMVSNSSPHKPSHPTH